MVLPSEEPGGALTPRRACGDLSLKRPGVPNPLQAKLYSFQIPSKSGFPATLKFNVVQVGDIAGQSLSLRLLAHSLTPVSS